jgi:hypothetical protein
MNKSYRVVLAAALAAGFITFVILYYIGIANKQPIQPEIIEKPRISGTLVEAQIPAQTLDEQQLIQILPGSRVIIWDKPYVPTEEMVPKQEPTAPPILRARLSHYWPEWGPPNCHAANWTGEECTALLTDGKQWQHWTYWAGRGTACPREFKRGTVFRIPEFGDYICIDRGGAINRLEDGTFFLDLLTATQPYVPGGEVVRDQYSPRGSFVVAVTIVEN